MNSRSVISALDRKFLPLGQNFLFVRVIMSAQTPANLYFGLRKLYFGPIKMAVLMKNGHFYLPKKIFLISKGRETPRYADVFSALEHIISFAGQIPEKIASQNKTIYLAV